MQFDDRTALVMIPFGLLVGSEIATDVQRVGDPAQDREAIAKRRERLARRIQPATCNQDIDVPRRLERQRMMGLHRQRRSLNEHRIDPGCGQCLPDADLLSGIAQRLHPGRDRPSREQSGGGIR